MFGGGLIALALIGIVFTTQTGPTTTAQRGTWTFSQSGTTLNAVKEGSTPQIVTGSMNRPDQVVSSVVTAAAQGDTIDFAGVQFLINNTVSISTTKSLTIQNGNFHTGKDGVRQFFLGGNAQAIFVLRNMVFNVVNQSSWSSGITMEAVGLSNPSTLMTGFTIIGSSIATAVANFHLDITDASVIENDWKFLGVCGGPSGSTHGAVTFTDQGNIATNFYMSTICGGDIAIYNTDTQQSVSHSTFLNYGTGIEDPSGSGGQNSFYSNTFDNTLSPGTGILIDSTIQPFPDVLANNVFINSAFTIKGPNQQTLLNNIIPPIVPTAITVGVSPFTYTNRDNVTETVYIAGGTISQIQVDAVTVFTVAGDVSVRVEPFGTVKVTYTVAPTMKKQY